jgi:hypothetical protein
LSKEYYVNAKEWEEFCKEVGGETKASDHIKAAHGDVEIIIMADPVYYNPDESANKPDGGGDAA